MGKNKRLKRITANNKPPPTKKAHSSTTSSKASKPNGITKPKPKGAKKHIQTQHTAPTIPFQPHEKILLVGEGDLSFARALVEDFGCTDVIATVYESRGELVEKYPDVVANIAAINLEEQEIPNFIPTAEPTIAAPEEVEKKKGEGKGKMRFGVDATKPGPVWRELKGKCQRVIFNFPHVGGKSKDVNRQVRYNQELLVAFFKVAQSVLAPSARSYPNKNPNRNMSTQSSPSSIIVTLFEGEPYTLWNVKDLARHAGLQVERSFRFQWGVYGGYKHVRTLGTLRGENGWKGEERAARSYVFVRRGEEGVTIGEMARRRWGDREERGKESEEEDDSENEEWGEDTSAGENQDGADSENSEEWNGIDDSKGEDGISNET